MSFSVIIVNSGILLRVGVDNIALIILSCTKYQEKMSLSKTDYDIIVAGGGLAGLIVASSAAFYSNQRMKVLVLDRNSIDIQGRKTLSGWICGFEQPQNIFYTKASSRQPLISRKSIGQSYAARRVNSLCNRRGLSCELTVSILSPFSRRAASR